VETNRIQTEHLPQQAPQPGAALVVARWNSWVQVYFPDEDVKEWVNLQDVPFEPASPPEATAGGFPLS
jgi:hypothetical protein